MRKNRYEEIVMVKECLLVIEMWRYLLANAHFGMMFNIHVIRGHDDSLSFLL